MSRCIEDGSPKNLAKLYPSLDRFPVRGVDELNAILQVLRLVRVSVGNETFRRNHHQHVRRISCCSYRTLLGDQTNRLRYIGLDITEQSSWRWSDSSSGLLVAFRLGIHLCFPIEAGPESDRQSLTDVGAKAYSVTAHSWHFLSEEVWKKKQEVVVDWRRGEYVFISKQRWGNAKKLKRKRKDKDGLLGSPRQGMKQARILLTVLYKCFNRDTRIKRGEERISIASLSST